MDTVIAFLGLTAAFCASAAVLRLAYRNHQKIEHTERLWKLVADRLGGRLERHDRLAFGHPGVHVVAKLDEVSVGIHAERSSLGEKRAPVQVTRVCADAAGTGGLRLEVFLEGPLAQFGKTLLDAQDVVVGDEGFDEKYVVRTNNEDLARAWLAEEARRSIEVCAPYQFSVQDGEVRATRAGLEEDVKLLEETARRVATLTRGGRHLLQDARTMAAAVGGVLSARGETWEPDGGVLVVIERQGTQILLDYVVRGSPGNVGERVLTRVRARALVNSEVRFVIQGRDGFELPSQLAELPQASLTGAKKLSRRFTVFSNDADGLSERLSPSLRQIVESLRPTLVTSDGHEVTVLLLGLVFDPEPVLQAVELAGELVSYDSEGPYR